MSCENALDEARAARADEAESQLATLAQVLLNRVELKVVGARCRLVEVECYLLSEQHADPFTHCHSIQGERGRWYLHRVGAGYKNGSFKGLDFTFGAEGTFGGVLVRSLETSDGHVVDGPCLCVEYLMKATGCDSVAALDARIFERTIWDETNALTLVDRTLKEREVFRTARVGLTLKRIPPARRPEDFIVRRYRFLTTPRATKKGRLHLILSLLEQGWSPDDIRALTGSPLGTIRRYSDARRAGASCSIDDFRGLGLDSEALCQLHGLLRT